MVPTFAEPGGRNFVFYAALVGAAGGGHWLGKVAYVLLTSGCTLLDLAAGIVALASLCLLHRSLDAWGPGGRRARHLFEFATVLGMAASLVL